MSSGVDVMGSTAFGIVALRKLHPVPENFRIYEAGWLGKGREVMKVTGAELRVAKRGRSAGQLAILIPGTQRFVYVTAEEMNEVEISNDETEA